MPIKSIRKQNENSLNNDQPTMNIVIPLNIVDVFEVWKVCLKDEEISEVFLVISGKYTLEGYKNGKWSDIKYRGFYSTSEEAQNNISGYLS